MNKVIVGLGEALWDCLPDGSKLGGAPANFAYHASQFGNDAYAISAIGNDALGDQTLKEFDEKHLKYVMPRVDYPTGTVQVELDEEGIPTYDIKQNVAWDNIPFTPEIENVAKHCGCVCFGSLAQRNKISRDTIHRFIDTTPMSCLKIFDINLRQNFYTKEIIQESLKACDILKINDEELVTIGRLFGYPGLDIENKCYLILGPKVEVDDTVGAGDSFTGSFASAILAGMPIKEAHKLAVEVSAFVCTQPGAMPKLPQSLLDRVK